MFLFDDVEAHCGMEAQASDLVKISTQPKAPVYDCIQDGLSVNIRRHCVKIRYASHSGLYNPLGQCTTVQNWGYMLSTDNCLQYTFIHF